MTIAEQLKKEGRSQGRKEGRREGRREGTLREARNNILRTLEVRFAPPPSSLQTKLDAIEDHARLAELFDTALTCISLEDFLSKM